ncbi:MAG: hypothetical protein DMF86_09425 [Acidobacteria bacterium]|nr:MAG: hypothetical protein DMF86_09425 [Acidobacteriota bacterium]
MHLYLRRSVFICGRSIVADPARFSFAHGGKDGTPFPVDTGTYDKTIEVLRAAVNKANIDRSERVKALERLVAYGEKRVQERMKTGKPD